MDSKSWCLFVYFAPWFWACVLAAPNQAVQPVFERNRPSPNERIINGEAADARDFPWNVVLTYRGNFQCGGTLISPFTVLTAHHCIPSKRARRYKVILGMTSWDDQSNAQIIRVKKINLHSPGDYHDIATLLLSKRATENNYVQPVGGLADSTFSGNEALTSDQCYVVGFGAYLDQKPWPSSSYLRKYNSGLVSNPECKQYVERNYFGGASLIHGGTICSLDTAGASCFGDSGGGLGCFRKSDGKFILVGVTSFGFSNFCLDPPSVYARVAYYKKWIRRNTKTG